jgi:host factor-I protein
MPVLGMEIPTEKAFYRIQQVCQTRPLDVALIRIRTSGQLILVCAIQRDRIMTSKPQTAGKKAAQSLQDSFFEKLIDDRTPLSCFLANGVRLSGTLQAVDQYTILITNPRGGNAPQLVNKSAISTICPDTRDGRY